MKPRIDHRFRGHIDWWLSITAILILCEVTPNARAGVTAKDFLARVYTNAAGARLPYRLFVPVQYDSARKYPLVLYWHWHGCEGTNNTSQLADGGQFIFLSAANQVKHPCFFLAPQIAQTGTNCDYYYGIGGQAAELLRALEAEFSVDPDRVYLTGISLGGHMTWGCLGGYPDLFAAGVPVSGGWTCPDMIEGYTSIRVPVWVFHAADDATVPVGFDDEAITALRNAGGDPIYTRYQTGGHGISNDAYQTLGLVDWVMAQRRGLASTIPPLLAINTPPSDPAYVTDSPTVDLGGTATNSYVGVLAVAWTNIANHAHGTASGRSVWSAQAIPLQAGATNVIVVTAHGNSYASGRGGETSFSHTLQVIRRAAAVRFVDGNSAHPTPPYTNWASAARVIQDAVDAAMVGDEIVVTNGTYGTGGRAVGTNVLVNRVAVDKPVTLRSVNGSRFTIIQGYQVPGTTNGDRAIRCVYLASGASLSGFTLTNGATRMLNEDSNGGGVWCESEAAVISDSVIAANSARSIGGGCCGGTLNNCALIGNLANQGGGAGFSTLNNCTLISNSAAGYGGGADSSTLNNCTVTGNSASACGGGADGSTLNNCTVTGNSAGGGGGASWSGLNNCVLTRNSASWAGGGAYRVGLNHCTVTGNSADSDGGGIYGGALANSIVYFNTAPNGANYTDSYVSGSISLNYCCTTPMPTNGVGNISLDPQLASAGRLSASSPCRGAGNAADATGTDMDGEPWANPPSIGCDEYHAGTLDGPLSAAIAAAYTNVATGFPVGLTALIEGRAAASRWDFGDGVVASNRPCANHAWTAPGNYAVVLRACNESTPSGVTATVLVQVVAQPVHYAAADSANPRPPYMSWATAARSIQDAVDAAVVGGTVLVTNGTYASGGRAVGTNLSLNRVAVDKPLTLRSVNGPEFTLIEGYQVPRGKNGDGAIRCVYLANGTSMSGFTLTNGATPTLGDQSYGPSNGGGVCCQSINAVVSNCVLTGNSAYGLGGGAYWGTLNNCTLTGNSAYGGGGACETALNYCVLTGNSADWGGGAGRGTLNHCVLTGNSAGEGGGADGSTLNNCTLSGNSANTGGGVCDGTLNNCIICFNTARSGANYYQGPIEGGILNYCCTTPIPTNGLGNITNAPMFVDYAGGNLRLQSNSPCINAGNNPYAPGPTDLDGNPRIVSGTVDIGAYEFQGPGSRISYAWLQQYGLPTDGSVDFADSDADGHNNWQEWRCQTCPTNAVSVLCLLSPKLDGNEVILTWPSMPGVSYFLERGTNFGDTPRFEPVATNIAGQPGTTSFTDTNAAALAPRFYRVGVPQ